MFLDVTCKQGVRTSGGGRRAGLQQGRSRRAAERVHWQSPWALLCRESFEMQDADQDQRRLERPRGASHGVPASSGARGRRSLGSKPSVESRVGAKNKKYRRDRPTNTRACSLERGDHAGSIYGLRRTTSFGRVLQGPFGPLSVRPCPRQM